MTKSLRLILVIGFALCFTSLRTQALPISLEPSAQTVGLGNPIDVAVRITDLGTPGTTPAISTFDLDISFDPGLLAFSHATFGDPVLGDQLDAFGLGGNLTAVTPGIGVVNLFELSFDLPEDLAALQAPSFTLATLTFGTTALGPSALGLTVNALGDELGEPLLANVSGAMVTTCPSQRPSSCSVPASLGWSVTDGAGSARCKHATSQESSSRIASVPWTWLACARGGAEKGVQSPAACGGVLDQAVFVQDLTPFCVCGSPVRHVVISLGQTRHYTTTST